MSAPAAVLELVRRFRENYRSYKAASYNEAQLRKEFLDPLFGALGWDVANEKGYPEPYKEVIHEDSIRIEGSVKAPDYCFRVGGERRFFVEAKKPATALETASGPSYQLRRYGWSAGLPLSVLTDFEEFAIYDCRIPPKKEHGAATARIKYLKFEEYKDRWAEIESVFSREALASGSFDRYVDSTKGRRGTEAVDEAFLDEIERWRIDFAQDFARENADLSLRELNYAVQVTIDRIVFLRICEDRGVEPYGQLQKICERDGIYSELLRVFRRSDDRYNSGLFHFRVEKGRATAPDGLTPLLKVGDTTLRRILKPLYYPDSPYEFSVLPADILGQTYERFLGNTLTLAPDRSVRVEQKPEVKKAGGVYYTPSFVVRYIVQETLGSLLEGQTPETARTLRIVDPSCGSGSFLIVAYQYLLDWYLNRYVNDNPERHARGRPPRLYRARHGDWRLTSSERKRILISNIFGVDIDPQAVEVTKLALLLKVLEGESEETIGQNLSLFQERALPDLDRNIRCGNSLVGTDYYAQLGLPLADDEERLRINCFDWEREFPEVFEGPQPGFDAVVGNPPYYSVDDTWGRKDPRLDYLKAVYPEIHRDKTDVLFYFLATAVRISRGRIGFIVSRAFREAYKADKLRFFIGGNARVHHILDFRDFYVFPGVGIATAIVTLEKNRPSGEGPAQVFDLVARDFVPGDLAAQREETALFERLFVPQEAFSREPWIFASEEVERVLRRIDGQGEPVSEILHVGKGMETGLNAAFAGPSMDQLKDWQVPATYYYTRVRNSNIDRFHISDSGQPVLFLEQVARFADLPQGLQAHLRSHEEGLRNRAAFKRGDCEWWRFTWPLHQEYVDRARIWCPYRASRNRFAFDARSEFLGLTDTTVLYENQQEESMYYILGLLNSLALTFRYRFIGKLTSAGQYEYFWNQVGRLSIPRRSAVPVQHDAIDGLVRRRVALSASRGRTPEERAVNERERQSLDRRIDDLAFQVYGLAGRDRDLITSRLSDLREAP